MTSLSALPPEKPIFQKSANVVIHRSNLIFFRTGCIHRRMTYYFCMMVVYHYRKSFTYEKHIDLYMKCTTIRITSDIFLYFVSKLRGVIKRHTTKIAHCVHIIFEIWQNRFSEKKKRRVPKNTKRKVMDRRLILEYVGHQGPKNINLFFFRDVCILLLRAARLKKSLKLQNDSNKKKLFTLDATYGCIFH